MGHMVQGQKLQTHSGSTFYLVSQWLPGNSKKQNKFFMRSSAGDHCSNKPLSHCLQIVCHSDLCMCISVRVGQLDENLLLKVIQYVRGEKNWSDYFFNHSSHNHVKGVML